MNEEQKQLRREFAKKQWEDRKKNPKLYSEVCQKMSEADKGHKPPKAFQKGNNPWNKGKNLSEEHKINISLSCKGKRLGNTNGFKKGECYWLGKKRPGMSNVKGFNRTGISPWNKDKECPQLAKENHWNWRNGISAERHSFFFKQLSKVLRHKCNYCNLCNSSEDLVVHHLNEMKQDNRLENLIVLCRSCHAQIHSMRMLEARLK
jgi:5-methylcytosine-specific restriction endonuclease McrA